MKYGIHLPNSGAFADPELVIEIADLAERSSLESVWVFDHILTPVEVDSKYPFSADGSYHNPATQSYLDALTVLSVVAGRTSRVRLGTRVLIAAYRHPVPLAKQLATLDVLSGGRLTVGVGAGWMREEFDALGVPWERRYSILDEHVALMRNTWMHGTTSFEGKHFRHGHAGFYPQPVQPGQTIPIVVGGTGDRALRQVAEWGDGWAVAVPGTVAPAERISALTERLTTLRRLAEEAGRDPDALRLVGQAPIDAPRQLLEAIADLGVHECDMMLTSGGQAGIEQVETLVQQLADLP